MDPGGRGAAIGEVPSDWAEALGQAASPERLDPIAEWVAGRRLGHSVLPAPEQVFAALRATPFDSVRAVILGQDPYPNRDHAMGLAFSVPRQVTDLPRSLKRIRAELETDCLLSLPKHGSLQNWTREGVLLLNTTLTVDEGVSDSHREAGWGEFTDAIIVALANKEPPVVFLLWGKPAQTKTRLVENRGRVAVASPHPMARQREGFRGSRPFSRANATLASPIDWRLDDGPPLEDRAARQEWEVERFRAAHPDLVQRSLTDPDFAERWDRGVRYYVVNELTARRDPLAHLRSPVKKPAPPRPTAAERRENQRATEAIRQELADEATAVEITRRRSRARAGAEAQRQRLHEELAKRRLEELRRRAEGLPVDTPGRDEAFRRWVIEDAERRASTGRGSTHGRQGKPKTTDADQSAN
jgi:uracil-DNA glycosylase